LLSLLLGLQLSLLFLFLLILFFLVLLPQGLSFLVLEECLVLLFEQLLLFLLVNLVYGGGVPIGTVFGVHALIKGILVNQVVPVLASQSVLEVGPLVQAVVQTLVAFEV
jgi:hypothetical protein